MPKFFDKAMTPMYRSYFEQCQTAFYYMSYQDYGESQGLRDYYAGIEPEDSTDAAEWIDWRRVLNSQGKKFDRVTVVRQPLTPYMRFLLEWGFNKTILVDSVGVIEVDEDQDWTRELGLSEHEDFWLLDSNVLVIQYHDVSTGDFRYGMILDLDDPDDWRYRNVVAEACRIRDTARRLSTPYEEYMKAS
jgi:hypothetical protein